MSVSDPSYTASSVALPVHITVARDADSQNKYTVNESLDTFKALELAHYFTGSVAANAEHSAVAAAGLYKGVWDTNQTFVTYSNSVKGDGFALYATYTITVTVDSTVYNYPAEGEKTHYQASDGSLWTAAQIAENFDTNNETVTLTVANDSSRAMIFSLGASAPSVAAGEGSKTLDTTLDGIYAGSSITPLTWKFGLYVEGEPNGTLSNAANKDSSAVSGNFTVQIAHR